ncbi:MAG: hypothetical protein M3O28_08765 [Actinomycetota bacterium]|nr:hypothetical protein [Actinomycetota bacterium]
MRLRDAAALVCSGVLAVGVAAVVVGSSVTASATPTAAQSCQTATYTLTSTPSSPNGWATEDGAPAYVADPNAIHGSGELEYQTPNAFGAGSKQNYFHTTSRTPLLGLQGLGYSVRNTGGPVAAYDLEAFTTGEGTSGYTTFVWEPGNNGHPVVGDGTWSVYTNIETGNWWSTHISSGIGSQADPQPLAYFEGLYPGAKTLQYGVGQGRNNAGSDSFVDDVRFLCGATNFEPACTTTITGTHTSVVVTRGTTCLVNATITGGISVARGAALDVKNSTVNGSISAGSPAGIQICGSTTGSIAVSGASGYVRIGDPTNQCAPNTINGGLTAVGNHAGGTISGNTITGSWTITANTPPFIVSGNHH